MQQPDVRRLTDAHRRAQLRLGATTVALLSAAWSVLDVNDLNGTVGRWLTVAQPIVEVQRRRSAQLASAYLTTVRTLSLGPEVEPFIPELAVDIDRRQVATSLLVTGPYALRSNLARAVPIARAVDIARASSAAAGMRHVLNGGRETITASIQADRRARGYARVASANACDFCSMLADRGAVYGADSAEFEAHDRCGCTAEPVYA